MKKSLPARPNLDHLRTQAKQLLSDLRAGSTAAARTFVQHLPAAKSMKPEQVRRAGFRLADAQSAIARKSGFAAWPGLARHVEQLRALEGEWRFASLEVDGEKMSAAMTGTSRILIDGDRFRMESPGGDYEGIFTIDVEAKPARIDIEFVEGPEAGNWSYGIYTLDGDDLVLCLGLTGAPRPGRFATTAGSGHALERLRRSSSARPDSVTGGSRNTTIARAPAAAVDETAFDGPLTPLMQELQGEWRAARLIMDGQSLPNQMLSLGSRRVTGNETKVTIGGQVMVHAKMRLDESRSPIAVDYLNIGRGAKTVSLGILELRGDVVTTCIAAAGAPRPADFSSPKGSGRILSEWSRK